MICPADSRNPRRNASILVVALVAMLVVLGLLGATLKGGLRDRRQLRVDRDLRQTELLVAAGIDRAAMRLADDGAYDGETWNVPAEEIVGAAAGRVVIEAQRDENDATWRVRIVAEYPLGGASSIRRSRTFTVQPRSSSAQE